MSATWVTYALLVGALLMLAANAMASAARRIGVPTRFVWGVAMAVLVALCFSAPLRSTSGSITVSGLRIVPGTALVTSTPSLTLVQRLSAVRAELRVAEQNASRAIVRMLPSGTQMVLPFVWMTSSALVVALMLFVNAMMAQRLRKWPRAELHGARVRLTHDVGPAVVGFAAPEIVIPGWLLARSDEEQCLAIAHEREHVRAGDHWLLAGGWLIVALMPWHPASWWMLSRLRLSLELDCDARVLRAGVATRSYGKMLIDIAGHCSGQRALSLALADHTSHLERRLLAMKSPRARYGRTRATILAATGAFAVLVACEKMPTSAEIENSDVAALEKKATEAALLSNTAGKTVYVVNGKQVTDSAAHALKANEVATVNIMKATGGNKVLISTKGQPLTGKGERAAADSGMILETQHLTLTKSNKKFDGLFIIDGQVASQEQFARLDREKILSVEVFKGSAATQRYSDPAAANGVISVTTKK